METDRDVLTGLPNQSALERKLKQAVAAGSGVALAMLDVDHFLEINEELGHDAGDRLLARLAALLEEEAPGGAHRMSGDEFALLLPGLSLEHAFLRMESLRARVASAAAHFDLPDRRGVTITIGVAQHPRDGRNVEALLRAADAALLSAKENGRNQVGLPLNEEMVIKSCYYPASTARKLRVLAERLSRKESALLREALTDVLRKYDTPRAA